MTPPILSIPACAALIDKPRNTVWRWVQTLPEWQGCIAARVGRKVFLSTQRLSAAGLIGATL